MKQIIITLHDNGMLVVGERNIAKPIAWLATNPEPILKDIAECFGVLDKYKNYKESEKTK